ncbi:hypothetical protein [Flavobacterium sp. 3HN19-14]|uniref:hypothetical protein n=1 Tax=Flavobacterium sp. 3HN19-14 TaxID=3448133 RepID=UPI003EE0DFFA
MKTKLLLFFLMIFAFANAQVNSVAVVGEAAGGWPGEAGNPDRLTFTKCQVLMVNTGR